MTSKIGKERRVTQIDAIKHIRLKSMWVGSKKPQTMETYILENNQFVQKDLVYPPGLLKIIDEVIVNAIDHHTHYPDLVKNIKISIDDNGTISVYNDGPGIIVELTKNTANVEMYTPQLIASQVLAGDNLEDDGNNIKGGTNGVGLKAANAFSSEMVLETVDLVSKLKYIQVFRDTLKVIEPPTITPANTKPYTRITFTPTYSADFAIDIKKFKPTLMKIIEARAWQAAAYVNAKVYFNEKVVPIKTFEDFCQMFTDTLVISTKMENPTNKLPWEVCFTVSEGKEQNISIVNGVFIPKGGTHINYIQKKMVEILKPTVEKEIKKSGAKFNKNFITNNVFIFMKGSIPSPEFLSQTKEAISDPIEKFEGYNLAPRVWDEVWNLIKPAVLSLFLKKHLGDVKTRANRGKVDVPKYKEAKFCRDAKKCHKCGIIITEGDSATGTADIGLLAKASPTFNYDWFGTFSIGGVPINGLKESVENKTRDDTELIKKKKTETQKTQDDIKMPRRLIPNAKLLRNERISSFNKIIGLDFNKTYDLTEIGDREWKTLRYGFIVGLTDQDLDGYNIFGLIATYIITYWPSLIKRNFIRRIVTPIVRAYPKVNKAKMTVQEFYSEQDFHKWAEKIPDVKNKWEINYYKGLGNHTEKGLKEVSRMFKNIDTKIRTYIFDNDAFKNMIIYYGKESKDRKIALANPVTPVPTNKLKVPISEQFCIDTKMFQRDNIIRKLPSMVDGFISSRRKVFFVARKNANNKIKVQGLAGKAVADANYHHGEASIEQTIIRMAQGFPMARNLPLLQPLGQFGTRGKGYKDAASSRYIYTMLNHKLANKLFRREDDYILDYEVDDGERYEPKFYMPIIPYVLLENNQMPATGWAVDIHARDIHAVFHNTREMIKGNIKKCGKLSPWLNKFKGCIKKHNNRNYYVGAYEWIEEDNALHIIELPPGICSNAYLRGPEDSKIKRTPDNEKKGIQTKEWIEDFEDNTTNESVDIMLYLKPGAYQAITADDSGYGNETFDPFEHYFELTEIIHHHINLVNEKLEVIEYSSYENVFNDWFVFRKKLYSVRVDREIILSKLEIEMLKNMQRFSKEHDHYNITNKTSEEEANRIISSNKYNIYNYSLLKDPKFTNVEMLIEVITNAKYGADYEYLLRMTYRDLTEGAFEKRDKQIKELEERIVYLSDNSGYFKGSQIWLKELDELEESVKEGLESDWCYKQFDYKFADD